MHAALDDPTRPDVRALLEEHLADMRATSPPESVHALEPDALAGQDVAFFSVRNAAGALLGCGALKALSAAEGEVKSMRTASTARGRGIGALILRTLLDEARRRGHRRVSLETGSQDFFLPARRLYERHGFTPCPPFGGYREDPNSVYLTLALDGE